MCFVLCVLCCVLYCVSGGVCVVVVLLWVGLFDSHTHLLSMVGSDDNTGVSKKGESDPD